MCLKCLTAQQVNVLVSMAPTAVWTPSDTVMIKSWILGDVAIIIKVLSRNPCYGLSSWALLVKSFSGERHKIC